MDIFSGQALCGTCRDETHRAKMFSQHDVIHMSKKTKELHRKVSKAFTTLDVSSHKIVITNESFSIVTSMYKEGTYWHHYYKCLSSLK